MCRAMPVIRDRLNVAVDVGIEVLASLALIDAAGNDVKQMWNEAVGDEELPLGVVVDSPRIAEPVRDDLEHILRRVVPPHAAIDLDAITRQHVLRKRLVAVVEAPLANGFSHL